LDELLALSRLDANKGLFDAKVNLIEAIHLAIRSIPYFTHPVKIIVNKQIIANKQNIAVENDRSANEFENLVFIKSDGGQIKRLFINLLTNIEKYAPGNTPVEIVIVKGTKTVTVKVVDHGKGVSPDELPKLYERFYTTEKSRNSELSGTGLGLAIVAEIVKKSGGVIKAENTSGSGLTHKIIFSSSVK
jgi:signal transduction histidine kinase